MGVFFVFLTSEIFPTLQRDLNDPKTHLQDI